MNKKKYTLQNRIMYLFVIAIVCVCLLDIFLFALMRNYNRQYQEELTITSKYLELGTCVKEALAQVKQYIQFESPDSLEAYQQQIDEAKTILDALNDHTSSEEVFYSLKGMGELLDAYHEENLKVIRNLSLDRLSDYNSAFMTIQKYQGYLTDTIYETSQVHNRFVYNKLDLLDDMLQKSYRIFICGVVLSLLGSIFVSRRLVLGITKPYELLTDYTVRIAEGNLDIEDIIIEDNLELEQLTASMNHMKREICQMMEQIKESKELENRYLEKENETLKMKASIQEMEFKMLQSQINPHFLFNTLNTIGNLAYLEGNAKIVQLIEAVSRMLRYSLRNIRLPVTAREELTNLYDYLFIQKTRFGEGLEILYDIDQSALSCLMPCMILQPLVENAVSHGLKPLDYEGCVTIRLLRQASILKIEIEDDGAGIPEDRQKALLNLVYQDTEKPYSGIGLGNVMQRIRHYTGTQDCFTILSAPGEGTKIGILLPAKEKEEVRNV